MTAVTTSEASANARLHGLPRTEEVDRVLRNRPVPSLPLRFLQRFAVRSGRLSFDKDWLEPLQRARRTALGQEAAQPPRFLVRVDEFPDSAGLDLPDLGLEASKRFHDVMAQEGVAHLMAVVPQWTQDPRNPKARGDRKLGDRDVELLHRMARERVTFAQHGTTHRTRYANPHRHSELSGLRPEQLTRLLDRGRAALAEVGIEPRVLVPPYNRFQARQWPVLASRYDVVTGGPESVRLLGFHGGPLWWGDAVYLPCYAPLYGPSASVLEAVERLLGDGAGGWIPIVLHMGWELENGGAALRRLAKRIAPYAVEWESEFLSAVDATRPR